MITAPPIKTGAVQERPNVDFVLSVTTSTREVGAPGVVVMIAPFPAADSIELPYAFIAVTVACTFVPHSRLNGAALRAVTGTVQVVAVDADISQLAV